jgi:hypothetical protein
VDGTSLEQRAHLFSTRLQLSGQVERLTGVLPGLIEASVEERDRAELPEVSDITAAHPACAEIVPARFLQEREALGDTSHEGVCLTQDPNDCPLRATVA